MGGSLQFLTNTCVRHLSKKEIKEVLTQKDDDNWTWLHVGGASNLNQDSLQLLLDACTQNLSKEGMNQLFTQKDNENRTWLHFAARNDLNQESLQLLNHDSLQLLLDAC